MSIITVAIDDITYNSYKVSWTDSLPILGAGLTYYEDGVSKGFVDVTGLSEYTVSSVTEGIDFSISLDITDADGTHRGTPGGTTLLRSPVATSAEVVDADEVRARWTCDAGTESGFYTYYKISGAGSFSLGATTGADTTAAEVSGLTGGNTYVLKVVAYNAYTTSSDSNEVEVYLGQVYSDTVTSTCTASDSSTNVLAASASGTDTCTASDSVTTSAVMSVTETSTVTASDSVSASQSIRTDFAYFWGTGDGYVHKFSSDYASDNGTSITATWTSKTIDFAEDSSDNTGKWKTLYKIEYIYKDDYASVPTVFKVSTDGGLTWTTQSKDVGDYGDGRMGGADYFWNKTGQFFVVKIEWPSSTKTFQFFGFDMVYDTQGDEWDVV